MLTGAININIGIRSRLFSFDVPNHGSFKNNPYFCSAGSPLVWGEQAPSLLRIHGELCLCGVSPWHAGAPAYTSKTEHLAHPMETLHKHQPSNQVFGLEQILQLALAVKSRCAQVDRGLHLPSSIARSQLQSPHPSKHPSP